VYRLLSGAVGIPKVQWFGVEGDNHVMVLDQLGPSTEEVFNYCSRTFSLKTVLMLADQMLACIEHLHSSCFIHRNIEPANLVMGQGHGGDLWRYTPDSLAKCYAFLSTTNHDTPVARLPISTPILMKIVSYLREFELTEESTVHLISQLWWCQKVSLHPQLQT